METWKHPKDYGGFSPDSDYILYTRTRDSDILTESNWDFLIRELKAEAFDDGSYLDSEGLNATRPAVYHWRAGHWACGWVEYLMIRHDAPADIIEKANGFKEDMESYPVLDENDFTEREWNYATEVWRDCYSIEDRIELIRKYGEGTSIFQARRDYLPDDPSGMIFEVLRTP